MAASLTRTARQNMGTEQFSNSLRTARSRRCSSSPERMAHDPIAASLSQWTAISMEQQLKVGNTAKAQYSESIAVATSQASGPSAGQTARGREPDWFREAMAIYSEQRKPVASVLPVCLLMATAQFFKSPPEEN